MAKNFVCGEQTTVQTAAGKLRGFQVDGTYTFHGIKYANARRFQAPMPVKPWEGVKDALSYGFVCPMLNQDKPNGELMVPHRYWPMNEHCQYLNIWTQSLDKDAKKPVMVWLHGGGFAAGSSIEQVAYDGENMSKYGDVVVVTLNHRLNILGYLDLSAFGDKYANSANAGNADMIAALQWVKENIARFGGDPDNVTLFGQSGGGMKIWSLMNTPAADGLFHKGIIQSGLLDKYLNESTDGTVIVKALMEELKLDDVEDLEKVPYYDLANAYNKVSPMIAAKGGYVGGMPMANEFYLGDPRIVGFSEHAKTIPIMIGTVFGEFAFGKGIENKYQMTEEEIMPLLKEKYEDKAEVLVPLFKEAYPDKNLSDLVFVDRLFRLPTLDFIAKKSACPQAPTWSYMFTYEFPIDGGKPAWHCSELPFVFHNTDKVPVCNIPGVSDQVEDTMFNAWISFARHGDPNCKQLPQWNPSIPGDEATMILDRVCEVRHNHDHKLMDVIASIPFVFKFPDPEDEEEFILH